MKAKFWPGRARVMRTNELLLASVMFAACGIAQAQDQSQQPSSQVPEEGEVQLDTRRMVYIDEACLGLVQDWLSQRESEGQIVEYDRRRLRMSSDEGPGEEIAVAAKKSA